MTKILILKVDARISHNTNFFITNIDNTSERNLVSSTLNINIMDKVENCEIYQSNNEILTVLYCCQLKSILPATCCLEKIKRDNTENLIKLF